MPDEILVSVVIPCFNHGQFLPEAIQSIDPNPWAEIIVVDDGSTDEFTLEVLNTLEANGTLLLRQENKGVSFARNLGISRARGKYILPLDADNILLPAIFQEGIAFLETQSSVDVVYGNKQVFGERNYHSINRPFDLSFFLYHHHIDTCALFRKEVWEAAGGFDENMPYPTLEDWAFWLKAVEAGKVFHYLPFDFFRYRFRKESKLRTHSRQPSVRLAMTWFFLERKERVLSLAEASGAISGPEGESLRLRWYLALAWRAIRAKNLSEWNKALSLVVRNHKSGSTLTGVLFRLAGQKIRSILRQSGFL